MTPPNFVRLLSLYGIAIIYTDAVRVLYWIFSMYFLLSDGGSPRLVKKMEVELAMKPLHPTSIENTFVIPPFLTHCSRRSSYFPNLCWCAQLKFSSKRTVNSITKTFFPLMDQMTILERYFIWKYEVMLQIGCDVPVHAAMMVYTYFYAQVSKHIYIYIYIHTLIHIK